VVIFIPDYLPFDKEVLKERIRQKYNNGQLPGQGSNPRLYSMGKTWTPEEILNEVENETSAGYQFMQTEQKWIEETAKYGKQ
jgi:hypothetical protein